MSSAAEKSDEVRGATSYQHWAGPFGWQLMKTQLTLVDLTGILGVGSLQFLALYLFYGDLLAHAFRRNAYIDALGTAVFLTIPAIVTMYLLGLLSVLIADQLFFPLYQRYTRQETTRLLVFGSESQMLQDFYEESARHQRLLKGSLLAFLGLALALSHTGYLMYSLLIAVGLLAAVCPFLALRIQRQLDDLATQLCNESGGRLAYATDTSRSLGAANSTIDPRADPASSVSTKDPSQPCAEESETKGLPPNPRSETDGSTAARARPVRCQ